jgi:predicted RNA-binding protein with PIN domain
VADATLYLFDGYNLLHAGPFTERGELVDALASFVATKEARGVVVFDGVGRDLERGPLSVRFVPHADSLLERLAADHRERERVLLVSSDSAVVGTAGRQVAKLSSQTFFRDLEPARHRDDVPGGLADKLDSETRERLERLRRGLR